MFCSFPFSFYWFRRGHSHEVGAERGRTRKVMRNIGDNQLWADVVRATHAQTHAHTDVRKRWQASTGPLPGEQKYKEGGEGEEGYVMEQK